MFAFRTLVNNHVFFQHPDLVRILGIHENVIAIMMNSIARASQDESGEGEGQNLEEDTSHEMVVACSRFLCYFCRTSRQNQKAMFDHLVFILEQERFGRIRRNSIKLCYRFWMKFKR